MIDMRKTIGDSGNVVATDNWSVAPAIFFANKQYVVPKITHPNYIQEVLGICKKEDIKVIGIRHGEKMYETLLTNEECAKAIDLGNFYRVPADNRGLNYDKYFKEGDEKRNTLTEFNSNNTRRLNLEETKETIAKLAYIQERLAED